MSGVHVSNLWGHRSAPLIWLIKGFMLFVLLSQGMYNFDYCKHYQLSRKKYVFGAFGSISAQNFYMGMQNGTRSWIFLDFRFTPSNKTTPPPEFSHNYGCTGRPRTRWKTGNTRYAGARITLTTFTRLTQNSTVGSRLALYGSIMHVATL